MGAPIVRKPVGPPPGCCQPARPLAEPVANLLPAPRCPSRPQIRPRSGSVTQVCEVPALSPIPLATIAPSCRIPLSVEHRVPCPETSSRRAGGLSLFLSYAVGLSAFVTHRWINLANIQRRSSCYPPATLLLPSCTQEDKCGNAGCAEV